jgi:lauroyl/myristoyl acyltransferase
VRLLTDTITNNRSHPMEIKSDTVVNFRRLLIRTGHGGVYYITPWGGKSQLATREKGIAAIRALESGQTVGQVEQALGQGDKAMSIRPLLHSMLNADLIHAIDGTSVSKLKFDPIAVARFLLRFYVLPHCLAVVRKCPIRLQRWGRYAVARIGYRRSLKQRAHTAEENIHTTSLKAPGSFKSSYLHHLMWNIADTDTVFSAQPAQARAWCDRSVKFEGWNNIEKALSLQKGVICAGLHFSLSRLVAPLLLSRGLDINLTATPSPNVDLNVTGRWHEEFRAVDPPGGKFRQIPNVDFASVKELIASLARNEAVLTFPDMHTIDPNSDEETRKRCAFFGVANAGFRPPTMKASIGGAEARMNEWAGWLAAQSGAPVLPVALIRRSNGNFALRIDSPIVVPTEGSRADQADAVNSELFRVLDRYIHQYPEQWFGWHRFHYQRVALTA